MTSFNIVDLITNNPITKLTETHNNNLLNKVKNTFNESEQQLFIASFYSYLNYHKTDDYIVDLDNIWKWLGFNKKYNATTCLEKYFKLDNDYKNFAPDASGAKTKGSGGHNIQKYYLNVKTFKSLCLKAGTKKADEIHEYYIKLEELIQEVLEEEATEMKNKLLIKEELITQKENELNEKEDLISQKNNEISQKDNLLKNANQDKYKTIEKTLVSQFPVNNECIYFGTIDNTNEKGEQLIKFGHSNNLPLRVQDHHKTYDNFILRDAFKVHNRQEIENAIKAHPKIKSHLRSIEVNGYNKHEILAYDATYFTITRLSKYIKDIISEKTYNIENFNKLIEENNNYKTEVERLGNENEQLKIENNEYREKNEKLTLSLKTITEKCEINQNNNILENSFNIDPGLKSKFDKFISECCILHNDLEVDSTTIVAQFRIYNRAKPTKLLFENFNKYMRTRFLACRLKNQTSNQVCHGFKGIALKTIEYKKLYSSNEVENFLFENCAFSPNYRAATNKIVEEFINYKKNNDLLINNNEDKDMKNYLKNCQYIVGGPIRLHNIDATFEGYYGITLKNDLETNQRICSSSSGKSVQKIDSKTQEVLNSWSSIAKAALHEEFSSAKMSRAIKNNTLVNDSYYILVN
jgi:predicted nuclease with TOPRIM domain